MAICGGCLWWLLVLAVRAVCSCFFLFVVVYANKSVAGAKKGFDELI